MEQEERPEPPQSLKPWYYQDWFLHPMIVFWPLWPVLIIRSPWHNGLISGAIAWAMLFSGGYLILVRQLYQSHSLNQFALTVLIPGVLFTVITQVHWFRHRKVVRAAVREAAANSRSGDKPLIRPRRPRSRRSARRPR